MYNLEIYKVFLITDKILTLKTLNAFFSWSCSCNLRENFPNTSKLPTPLDQESDGGFFKGKDLIAKIYASENNLE